MNINQSQSSIQEADDKAEKSAYLQDNIKFDDQEDFIEFIKNKRENGDMLESWQLEELV